MVSLILDKVTVCLRLWSAVTVAAGVISDALVLTMVTAFDMAAEGG